MSMSSVPRLCPGLLVCRRKRDTCARLVTVVGPAQTPTRRIFLSHFGAKHVCTTTLHELHPAAEASRHSLCCDRSQFSCSRSSALGAVIVDEVIGHRNSGAGELPQQWQRQQINNGGS